MEVIDDNPVKNDKHCPACGAKVSAEAFFCANCGKPLGSRASGKFKSPSHHPPSHQAPSHQAPSHHPPSHQPHTEPLAIISLVITVIGFFASGFLGPLIGVILGHIALRRIDASDGYLGGRSVAVASLVFGYLFLAIGLLLMIVFGVFIGTAITHGLHGSDWQWLCPWWR